MPIILLEKLNLLQVKIEVASYEYDFPINFIAVEPFVSKPLERHIQLLQIFEGLYK